MNIKYFRYAFILLAVTPILFIGWVKRNTTPVQRQSVRKEPQKEEVLYISGHGANGRVWGHITMKGNKGRGSVTDEHENALTVTCTRQGEELICYDQNSRQYIFRL